ncbi:MAG: hypothetical protein RQ885_12325 [Desulfurococcales archaeon]|jgi:hypothetical protein|nr:hypothetical protein [Desulfurococcales archaeon]
MPSLARIFIAFILYIATMIIFLTALPAIFTQSYVLAYIRPYQLMAFANILIILTFIIIYLLTSMKTMLYATELALAALIPINYLDIYTRISQGVNITLLPLFTRINGPSGPSLALDLGQVAAIALAILLIRNTTKNK